MPPPRPLDLLPGLRQPATANADVPVHRAFGGDEPLVSPGDGRVEEHGERGVLALARLLPHTEAVLEFLDRGAGGADLLDGVRGTGDGCEGGGLAELVGRPDELA